MPKPVHVLKAASAFRFLRDIFESGWMMMVHPPEIDETLPSQAVFNQQQASK